MRTGVRLLILVSLLLSLVVVMPTAAQDEDRTLIVGSDIPYEPFVIEDEDGNYVGFEVDLMTAIAADAGFEFEFVDADFSTIFTALAEGEFDLVMSAATITEERELIVDFSDPYFPAGQSIAVKAALAEEVSSPEDLAGLRVGVQLNTTGAAYAMTIEGAEVVEFDDINIAFQALGNDDIDAIVSDGPTSDSIIANNPDFNAVLVAEGLTEEYYGIAVNSDNPELLDAINTALANVIADGTYAEIYEEWFGRTPPEQFLPAEEVADAGTAPMEIDFTDPVSVTMGLLFTFFAAEDASEILAFACEGSEDSPLFPTNETLQGFAGMSLADASGLEFEVEELEEGVVFVTPVEGSTITLMIGDAEQELPMALLLGQLGITGVRLEQNDEGMWLVCPSDEPEVEATEESGG